jgi:hypothetical protein
MGGRYRASCATRELEPPRLRGTARDAAEVADGVEGNLRIVDGGLVDGFAFRSEVLAQ